MNPSFRAVRALAMTFLSGAVVQACNVSAGRGRVIDWREVKSGETLVEDADAFDTALVFLHAVGPFSALRAIGREIRGSYNALADWKEHLAVCRSPWCKRCR